MRNDQQAVASAIDHRGSFLGGGLTGGRPLGLAFVGRPGDDDALVELAELAVRADRHLVRAARSPG